MGAVFGHHGKPPEEETSLQESFAVGSRSRQDAIAFIGDIQRLLNSSDLISDDPDVDNLIHKAKRASWWVAGFAILCDWVGSNVDFFPYQNTQKPLETYWEETYARAEKAVRKAGLISSQSRKFRGFNADARVKPLVELFFTGDASYLLTHSGPRLDERCDLPRPTAWAGENLNDQVEHALRQTLSAEQRIRLRGDDQRQLVLPLGANRRDIEQWKDKKVTLFPAEYKGGTAIRVRGSPELKETSNRSRVRSFAKQPTVLTYEITYDHMPGR
jgi:hypothetical protein